jgi:hypothetical protein
VWIKLAGGLQKVIEIHDRFISLLTKAKKGKMVELNTSSAVFAGDLIS